MCLPQIIPLDRRGLGMNERADFHIAAWRLILDLSFFILITTIGLNIVFGIIVDSFSELRDERVRNTEFPCDISVNSTGNCRDLCFLQTSIQEDQKLKCFICDLPSHEFDRHGKVHYNIVNIIDHERAYSM